MNVIAGDVASPGHRVTVHPAVRHVDARVIPQSRLDAYVIRLQNFEPSSLLFPPQPPCTPLLVLFVLPQHGLAAMQYVLLVSSLQCISDLRTGHSSLHDREKLEHKS
jgi:hypothetical protein